jgi:hypothetical protein
VVDHDGCTMTRQLTDDHKCDLLEGRALLEHGTNLGSLVEALDQIGIDQDTVRLTGTYGDLCGVVVEIER